MKSRRFRLFAAITVSTTAGHFAGIFYHGALGIELIMELATCLVVIGGITGGFLQGWTFRERCWYVVPFSVLSIVLMFLTYSYLSLRGWLFIPELIIPFAVAFIPFVVTYQIVSSNLESLEVASKGWKE